MVALNEDTPDSSDIDPMREIVDLHAEMLAGRIGARIVNADTAVLAGAIKEVMFEVVKFSLRLLDELCGSDKSEAIDEYDTQS